MKTTRSAILLSVILVVAAAAARPQIWEVIGTKVSLVNTNLEVRLWPSDPESRPLEIRGAVGQLDPLLDIKQGANAAGEILNLAGARGAFVLSMYANGGLFVSSQDDSGFPVLYVDGSSVWGTARPVEVYDINSDPALFVDETGITTGTPSGGTAAPWKLGSKVDATVTLATDKYVEVEIGGIAYKLALAE